MYDFFNYPMKGSKVLIGETAFFEEAKTLLELVDDDNYHFVLTELQMLVKELRKAKIREDEEENHE